MGSREEIGRTLDPRPPSYLYVPEVRGGTREYIPASTGGSHAGAWLLLRRLLSQTRPDSVTVQTLSPNGGIYGVHL